MAASGFDQNLCLGMALAQVAASGEAIFSDPVERETLARWLQNGFPAAQHDFWDEMEAQGKAALEREALLSALHVLVTSQFERVAHSAAVLSQNELLPRFRELWREALNRLHRGREGETAGPVAPKPAGEELDTEDGDDVEEQSGPPDPTSDLLEAMLERVSREQDPKYAADAKRKEGKDLYPWERFFDLLQERLQQAGIEPDSPSLGPVLAAWKSERSSWVMSRRKYPWDAVLESVEILVLEVLGPALLQQLTDAERSALWAAVRAILVNAARVEARRGDSLSDHLSQTQMRNLRRAYGKREGLRERLKELSDICARIRASASSEGWEDRSLAPEKLKRSRGGRALLDLAEEARKLDLPRVVEGLEAADKVARGLPVSEAELALRDEDAKKWVQGDRRLEILGSLPPIPLLAIAVVQNGTHRAAMWFAEHCLLLALLCWPEGTAQSASQTPPSE